MVDYVTVYRFNGEVANMASIDADRAVKEHRDEWSKDPWTEEGRKKAQTKWDKKQAEASGDNTEKPAAKKGGADADAVADAVIAKIKAMGEADQAERDAKYRHASEEEVKAAEKTLADAEAKRDKAAEAVAKAKPAEKADLQKALDLAEEEAELAGEALRKLKS